MGEMRESARRRGPSTRSTAAHPSRRCGAGPDGASGGMVTARGAGRIIPSREVRYVLAEASRIKPNPSFPRTRWT